MNLQPLSPVHTHNPIGLPIRAGQFDELPQESRKRWFAYPCPDEAYAADLALEITISHPELFRLPEVGPDEFEAVFDVFLS